MSESKGPLEEAEALKQTGNEFFGKKEYSQALLSYSNSIKVLSTLKKSSADQAKELLCILHSNSGACHLELGNLVECVTETTKSVDINPNFVKALWRRSQANQRLSNYSEAAQDLQHILRVQPKNKEAVLELQKILQFVKTSALTVDNVQGLLDVLQDSSKSDKHEEAMSKLFQSSKDSSNATLIVHSTNGLEVLTSLLKQEKLAFKHGSLRILITLSRANDDFAIKILRTVGIDFISSFLDDDEFIGVTSALALLTDISLASSKKLTKEENAQVRKKVIDLEMRVVNSTKNHDNLKYVEHSKGAAIKELIRLPWEKSDVVPFVEQYLGDVLRTTSIGEIKYLVSMFLSKLLAFGDGTTEHAIPLAIKTVFQSDFLTWMTSSSMENSMTALYSLSSLLLADVEVGVQVFLKNIQPIIEKIDLLKEEPHWKDQAQFLTADILASSSSHKSFQKLCEPELLDELLVLLKSNRPDIEARVLSITSKLASGNEKIAQRVMENAHRSIEGILRIITTNSQDSNIMQWSVEALCFLTLQPSVREELLANTKAMNILYNLAKSGDNSFSYGLSSIFTNLTRYLPRNDEVDKLKAQLSDFAGGNKDMKKIVPHELESDENAAKRCSKLVASGLTSVLYQMIKENHSKFNPTTRQTIAEVFTFLANNPKNRGKIVQDGGIKALLLLYNSAADPTTKQVDQKLENLSAHAMAKISISVDPNLGLKDSSISLVSPLMKLLKSEEGLQQFEAMLGLTNLALVGEETVKIMLRDHGFSTIEMLQLSSHTLTQRAATELLCNMVMYDEVAEEYKTDSGGNRSLDYYSKCFIVHREKIEDLWRPSQCEDPPTCVAASGTLAILSSDEEMAIKIREVLGIELFLNLSCDENEAVQHRGIEVLKNVILKDKETSEKMANSAGMELISKIMEATSNPSIKNAASIALEHLKSLSKQ